MILGAWSTEHHDTLNTGRSPIFFNVTQFNGACPKQVTAPLPGYFFAASGATSTDGRKLFIGDSSNTINIIDMSQKNLILALQLTGNNTGREGIVAPPCLSKRTASSDFIFVGSTVGRLYALDSSGCLNGGTCQLWVTELAGPAYAAPRFTIAGVNATYPMGIVMVAVTSATSDTGGVLQGVNVANGKVLWLLDAQDPNVPQGFGLRYVPAVDPARPTIGYIAWGRTAIAFDIETGDVISKYLGIYADPFVSSPSMPFGEALLLQSASSTLWRVHVLDGPGPNVTLVAAWKCFYPEQDASTCHYWNSSSSEFYPVLFLGDEEPVPLSQEEQAAIMGDGQLAPDSLAYGLQFPPLGGPGDDGFEVLSMGDPFSGARRLQGGPATYPFATPAILPDEMSVAFGTWSVSGVGMFVSADSLVGKQRYWFNGTAGVQFGVTRSSAAVDRVGMVFISSISPDGATSHPVIWALDVASQMPNWIMDLGEDGDLLGSASPIVTVTNLGDPMVIAASENQLWFFTQGKECPSTTWQTPCSGHGDCDCDSGICSCTDPCYTGPACNIPVCQANSLGCQNGQCICNACFSGPTCSTPKCSPNAANCTSGTCTCKPCYSDPTCGTKLQCPTNSWGCSNGACLCLPCWSGPQCTQPTTCPSNFACNILSGKCDQCASNCMSGANCNVPISCYNGGTCNNATGACTCPPCFTGPTCAVPTNCGNGTCNAAFGGCVCNQFYTGATCNQCTQCNSGPGCATECSNIGVCAMKGCDCPDGIGGQTCQTQCPPCFTGSSCTVFNHCSGHGVCRAAGCDCSSGYEGWTCANKAPPKKGANGGAVAGGVIVALAFVGACGVLYYKRTSVLSWWATRSAGSSFSKLGGGSSTRNAVSSSAYAAAPAPAPATGSSGHFSSSGAYGTL